MGTALDDAVERWIWIDCRPLRGRKCTISTVPGGRREPYPRTVPATWWRIEIRCVMLVTCFSDPAKPGKDALAKQRLVQPWSCTREDNGSCRRCLGKRVCEIVKKKHASVRKHVVCKVAASSSPTAIRDGWDCDQISMFECCTRSEQHVCVVWRGVVRGGIVWFGVVWCGVWCG